MTVPNTKPISLLPPLPPSPPTPRPKSGPTRAKPGARPTETAVGDSLKPPSGGSGGRIATGQPGRPGSHQPLFPPRDDEGRKEEEGRQSTPDLILTPGLDSGRIQGYENKKKIMTSAGIAKIAIFVIVTVNTATLIPFAQSLLTMAAENAEQLLHLAKNQEIYASAAESFIEVSTSAGFLEKPLLSTTKSRLLKHPHFTQHYVHIED